MTKLGGLTNFGVVRINGFGFEEEFNSNVVKHCVSDFGGSNFGMVRISVVSFE